MENKKTLGWIGFGDFGKFFVPFLKDHFEIHVLNRSKNEDRIQSVLQAGGKNSSLEEVCKCDYLILATPVQYLEDTLIKIKDLVNERTLVMDVCSVKEVPVSLMKKYLKEEVDIIATHPLFGPMSGREGISGLNVFISNVRGNRIEEIRELFGKKLWLNVIEKTPKEHDIEMANVQVLTHFISRAINDLDDDVLNSNFRTNAYEKLIAMCNLLGQDSWDLFKTIQDYNPYAKEMRKIFLCKLNEIEIKLDK